MISVLVPVPGEEPALVDTLAALVPAVADGLVRDLVLAGPSGPFLDSVADGAGCGRVVAAGSRVQLISAALGELRSNWVLVLEAGMVPGGAWAEEAEDFVRGRSERAAVFTLVAPPGRGRARALAVNMAASLAGRAHPAQGLLAPRKMLESGATGRVVRLASPMLDRRRAG
jgi:hypothetical protein